MSKNPSATGYQVIARRYRPAIFKDVIGQQAVVRQLHQEITEGRVGHGYLFCGPRGTGKTSMARIFAKALNCVKGPTTEPCGTCSHCQEIAGGTHLDVIEVDAATYTKVDSTRELLEGLSRAPFSARYKVYIIDEVHMLSTHSFNALLKSLEEPPSHVVFVLATTNPEKIPETVLSRCRRCTFERIATTDVTRSLSQILDKEKVRVNAEERQAVLGAIALASDGGLRDAQVLLDQLISLTTDELRLETVRSLLGVVEGDLFLRLLTALVDRDTQTCLRLVADLVDRGRDLSRFVKMFLSFLRDAMMLKAGAPADLLRVADATSPEFRAILERATLPFLLNIVQQFLDLEERLRGAAPPRFLLEFALIKLTAIDPRLVLDPEWGGAARSTSVRGGGDPTPAPRPPRAAPRAQATPSPRALAAFANDSAAEASIDDDIRRPSAIEAIHTSEGDRWAAFVRDVAGRQPMVRHALEAARLVEAETSKLRFELSPKDRAMRALFDRAEIVAAMREAARAAWGRHLVPYATVAEAEGLVIAAPELDYAPDSLSESAGDVAAPNDLSDRALFRAPVPQPAAEASSSANTGAPVPFLEALEKFPEFREAVELIERHFGAGPVAFNGRKLNAAS